MRPGIGTIIGASTVTALLLAPLVPAAGATDGPGQLPAPSRPVVKDNASPPAPSRNQARALAAEESPAPTWAGTPAPAGTPGSYVLGNGGDVGRYIGAADGPFRATFAIPYTAGKYDASGHLLPTDPRYGKTATLALDVYDVDSQGDNRPPESDEVLINGQPATNTDGTHFLTGHDEAFTVNVLTIPMSAIVFPRNKNKTAANTVQINMDIHADGWAATVGWLKLDVSGNPLRPIILVHGLNGHGTDWGPVDPPSSGSEARAKFTGRLRLAGFKGKFYEPQLGGRDSQEANEPLLAKEIDKARAETGSQQVDVIAHSKGGLDTRNYIISHPGVVAHLSMVATPNGGSPDADLVCFIDQSTVPWLVSPLGEAWARDKVRTDFGPCDGTKDAVYDLQQWWVQDVFNPATPDQPQVGYSVIAGNVVNYVIGLFGVPPTDLAVPVYSAFWLAPFTGPHDSHPGLERPVSPVLPFDHSGLIDNPDAPTATMALCEIYPDLASCSTAPGFEPPAARSAVHTASAQNNSADQETITGGYSVTVAAGQTATVPASSLTDAQRVTLINGSTAQVHLVNGEQAVGSDGQIDTSQPLSVINNNDAPIKVHMVFSGVPSQTLTLSPQNTFPAAGTTASFTATLSGDPVTTAPTFTARRSDGTALTTTAMTADPTQPNTWHVDIALPANTQGTAISATAVLTDPALRYATSGVAVTKPVQLSVSPHGTYVDRDMDGTLDTLQVEFPFPDDLGPRCGTQFRLSLANADGAPVATRVADPCDSLNADSTVKLDFPISDLAGQSGPLTMSRLVVTGDDSENITQLNVWAVATDLGELPAVPQNLSVPAPLSIRPGSMSPAWVDSDGDQKKDALALTGTFTAPADGDYAVTIDAGTASVPEPVTSTVHLPAGLSQQTVVIPNPLVLPASAGDELVWGPVTVSAVGQPEISATNTAWQYLPPLPQSVIKAAPPKAVKAIVDGNSVTVSWASPTPGQTVTATVSRPGEGSDAWQPSSTTDTSATFTGLPWGSTLQASTITHDGRAFSFPKAVQFTVRSDLKVKLTRSPAIVTAGDTSTLTATITGSKPSGIGKPLSLWSSSNDWAEPVATAIVGDDGQTTFPVAPERSTGYWVQLDYDDNLVISSNSNTVSVKPTLTLDAPSGYVPPGQPLTLTGSATPLPEGSELVIERRDGDVWTAIATATVSDQSHFSTTVTPPNIGTFRYRARYISNGEWSDYANANSPAAIVRAR